MEIHVRGNRQNVTTTRVPPQPVLTCLLPAGHLGIDFRQLNVGIIKSTAKRPQNVFRKLAASANKPQNEKVHTIATEVGKVNNRVLSHRAGGGQQQQTNSCTVAVFYLASSLFGGVIYIYSHIQILQVCMQSSCNSITITFRPECNMSGIYVSDSNITRTCMCVWAATPDYQLPTPNSPHSPFTSVHWSCFCSLAHFCCSHKLSNFICFCELLN